MCQGDMDSNNIYLNWSKVNIQIVDIMKGNQIFYAQKLMTENDPSNLMDTEIYN